MTLSNKNSTFNWSSTYKDPIYEILIFCDALMKSYAAVVYFCVTGHNNIQTNLMFSKMRITPVMSRKKQTRKKCKELLAVLIGV